MEGYLGGEHAVQNALGTYKTLLTTVTPKI